MTTPTQLELAPRPATQVPFGGDASLERAAEAWIHSPGGRHVMKRIYIICARLIPICARRRQQLSMDYVIHCIRFDLQSVRAWLKQRGVTLPRSGGYALNNNHTSYISRHITQHRPEWEEHIEQRKVGVKKPLVRKTVTIVTESPL
jgi:hypothetical protein